MNDFFNRLLMLKSREFEMRTKTSLLNILRLSLCLLLIVPTIASAKTTRITKVHVQNLTGLEIESVSVVHKYSNVFIDKHDWGRVDNGKMTRRPMKIRYNTGAFTTGQDWWLVTWKYKDNNSLRYTSPNNFRGLIDTVERMHILPFEAVKASLSKAPALQRLAHTPTAKLAGGLMNTGSTKGFKKHLLRASDQANGVIITLSQNSVAFDSASGHSSTEGIRTKHLPPPPANTMQQKGPKIQKAVIYRQACANALQDKIAWNYQGSKRWNPANIKSLCGNIKVNAPAVCFNNVMHGGLNWGGGTKWKYKNAMNLCRSTENASRTIGCFRSVMKTHKGKWQHAINACKAS